MRIRWRMRIGPSLTSPGSEVFVWGTFLIFLLQYSLAVLFIRLLPCFKEKIQTALPYKCLRGLVMACEGCNLQGACDVLNRAGSVDTNTALSVFSSLGYRNGRRFSTAMFELATKPEGTRLEVSGANCNRKTESWLPAPFGAAACNGEIVFIEPTQHQSVTGE